MADQSQKTANGMHGFLFLQENKNIYGLTFWHRIHQKNYFLKILMDVKRIYTDIIISEAKPQHTLLHES